MKTESKHQNYIKASCHELNQICKIGNKKVRKRILEEVEEDLEVEEDVEEEEDEEAFFFSLCLLLFFFFLLLICVILELTQVIITFLT